ncbi:MAG: hypothetical protein KDD42_08785 [Bdellovibrionales bacterium]|nr:hypothetical protein [Bdellovibrionales bacterium]
MNTFSAMSSAVLSACVTDSELELFAVFALEFSEDLLAVVEEVEDL